MRLRVRQLFAAVLLTTAAACADAPPSLDEVVTAGAPVWGKTEVVEELRIGVEAGPVELMFGRVGPIAVGHDGSVYVADRQARVIRMFDEEGRFVRNVGREGQGPGEYLDVVGLRILPNGNLATWDQINQRVSIFRPGGEYVDSFRADSSSYWEDNNLEVDTTGNLYVRSVLRIPLPPGAVARAASRAPQPVGPSGVEPVELQPAYLRYSVEGEPLGSVPLPLPEPFPGRGAFQVMTLSCWSPLGYLVVGRNDAYKIELRSPGAVVSVTRDIEPLKLRMEEHAEWEARADYLRERSIQRGSHVEYPPVPLTKPYFRDIYAGEEGRIWVHRYTGAEKLDRAFESAESERPPITWIEPPTFDVFEPDGTFLGTVVLPHDTRVLALRGERVWGVHTDDAGVERVVRLRVEIASR